MTDNFVLPPRFLEGWTVLAVDDETTSLDIIRQVLSPYGAVVVTAQNAHDGLQLAKTARPKFILSDISMPVIDGWQMLNMFKQDAATEAIPVIALTMYALKGDKELALRRGFYNYILKPLDPFTFLTQVVMILADIPEIAAELDSRLRTPG
jgi:CheY-like chemotaxis protein